MTKVKKNSPKLWLDVKTCENIYETFRAEYKRNGDEPLPPFSSRYEGKLESILESIKLRYAQFEPNTKITKVAAAYFVHVTKSQALVNGNKRMGILFTTIFLYLNGYELKLSQKTLAELSLVTAKNKEKIPQAVKLINKVFEKKIKPRPTGFNFTIPKIVLNYIDKLKFLTKH